MEKYDFIFSIGASCRCSMGLREAGLQLLSFPFDWIAGPELSRKCRTIAGGFAEWLNREDLVLQNPEETENHLYYRNTRTGYLFVHDFHAKMTFDEQYPQICRKYARRNGRLLEMIGKSQKILAVYVNAEGFPKADFADARVGLEILRSRWPGKRIEMLLVDYREGVHWRQAETEIRDGVRMAAFDYRDRTPGEDGWLADHRLLGKWFRSGYAVDDYRTPAEIEAWKRKVANYKYDRYNATNFFAYVRNKLEYKLYVHLRKQLKRRRII